jgi:hypothetical protein
MVFFTAVLIVFTLYFLQADGLIYVTVIAVLAELANIFMTQTLSKSVEKKAALKFGRVIATYSAKIDAQKKTIKELENIREDAVNKLYQANLKIKAYEEKLEIKPDGDITPEGPADGKSKPIQATPLPTQEKETRKKFVDLPSGSNRKQLDL